MLNYFCFDFIYIKKMAREANEDIEMDDDFMQEDDVIITIILDDFQQIKFSALKVCNNEQFKDGLLNLTLMFIFMSKRQTGSSVEAEKGVDQKLLNAFLVKLKRH